MGWTRQHLASARASVALSAVHASGRSWGSRTALPAPPGPTVVPGTEWAPHLANERACSRQTDRNVTRSLTQKPSEHNS